MNHRLPDPRNVVGRRPSVWNRFAGPDGTFETLFHPQILAKTRKKTFSAYALSHSCWRP